MDQVPAYSLPARKMFKESNSVNRCQFQHERAFSCIPTFYTQELGMSLYPYDLWRIPRYTMSAITQAKSAINRTEKKEKKQKGKRERKPVGKGQCE